MSESTAMLRGEAPYVADVRAELLDGSAHAVFVRSTVAHARFSVDLRAAGLAPGVLAVVGAEDNPIHPTQAYSSNHPPRFAQPLLAETKVRYVGEPVAVVVAETEAGAFDAAELVVVEYVELAPVLDLAESARDLNLVFGPGEHCRRNSAGSSELPVDPAVPSNVLRTESDDGVGGERDPAKFDCDVVVEVNAASPRQVAAPIEGRAIAAVWSPDGDLHVWMSTQTPHGFRDRIAPMYELAEHRIHVIAGPFVGGAFGGKGAPGPEEQLVPYLARLVGRPVRWTERRTENLIAAPQGRGEEFRVCLAGDADGTFRSIRVEHLKDAGAYPSAGANLPNRWTWPMVHGAYRISHVEYEQKTVVTNRPPISALRGAGRAPVIAAVELAVERYGAKAGIDPAELRRKNLIGPTEMPYLSPTGFVFDTADYPGALDSALARIDYGETRSDQSHRRRRRDSRQLGIGIACYTHRTGGGGESAIVRIEPDGSATVVTGTTSQGHDHVTTWQRIVAAELGIAAERVQVIEGVTDEIATGVGAVGSRSVQTAGVAIHQAAVAVVDQGRELAAELLEASPGDVVLDTAAGLFHVVGTPSRSISWAQVAGRAISAGRELSCHESSDPEEQGVFPSGTHVAVVEVDIETGAWEVVRFVAVDDVGVRINPIAVTGQLHGGIALGIGQVLGEVAAHDDAGNPLATNFMDYSILTIDQVPLFELDPQVVASSSNPHGYKAVGESGPIGSAAAVHNAVLDAVGWLGVEELSVPVTPQHLWSRLQKVGACSSIQ